MLVYGSTKNIKNISHSFLSIKLEIHLIKFAIELKFYRWVVDHERDAFVIGVGGGGPSQMGAGYSQVAPYHLVLSIKGQVIKFEATFDAEGDIKDKSVIETINVYKVQIPKKLEKQKDEILDILKEALEAYGSSSGNHPEYLSAVHVKFN